MPIEIRELHIQVNISESGGGNSSGNGGGGSSGSSESDQKALIEIIVEKVLEVLKEKMER